MASSTPATTPAIVIRSKGVAGIDPAASTPKLREGYLLVRTTAVALNPTDWKHIEFMLGGDPSGARVGCDYAGVVVAVGPGVTQSFKAGDRVAGGVHGANQSQHEDGSFANYIAAKADMAIKIPDNITDEEASTLGVGVVTVGQALYQQGLKLNLPTNPLTKPVPILIYGGATATGILGIQYAKLSGYYVITTASPHNHEYLKSLGADVTIDYKSDSAIAHIAEAVKAAGHGPLRLVFDCISLPPTGKFSAEALKATGGADAKDNELQYTALLPVPPDVFTSVDSRIKSGSTLYYTAIGEAFDKYMTFPAVPEDLVFARSFWAITRDLLASGKLKPARTIVNRGGSGLEGVLVGLQELKADKVSGSKLVYTLSK